MNKTIDLKSRVVNYYDVDTSLLEEEIINYINKSMKVRFFGAKFNNHKYVFTGSPHDKFPNSITINGYRKKQAGERFSVQIG